MSDNTPYEDEAEKPRWQDKTLKAAGYGYLVGDAGMALAGGVRGAGWGSSVGGAATWFAGGLAAAHFGNPDHEKQLQIQAGKLEAHLKKKGIAIPAEARAQSRLLADKTTWDQVVQFMYEHPSELLNGMYALGSAMLLHGAVTKELTQAGGKTLLPRAFNQAAFQNVSSKFWIGALVGAGALTGLLVREDPEARKKTAHHGIIERAMAYVQEQPLRMSAALYTVNNGFLGLQAWQDFAARNTTYASHAFKPHYASTVQLAAYLFSNLMLSLSSRSQITRKGFAAADMAKLEHAAASIIAAQPPQMQQTVLADISQFMAREKGVNLTAPELAQHLASRVTQLTGERMQVAANGVKHGFADTEKTRRAEIGEHQI